MKNYEINSETLLIMPLDINKSKVYEFDNEYIVDMSPLNIIKNSCLFFGCSFDGRKEAAKENIGIDKKVPILVESSKRIIFFPVTSCINSDSIWISYQNLLKYNKKNKFSTVLYFSNDNVFELEIKFNLVDNQVVRCIKLDSFFNKRSEFLKNQEIFIEEKT